ncbi:MAG: dienelactone hydrolase family protein [Sediminibacterium sp. Gen4]|jgi:carboxymethylenebutenolidase|uniref:dienelactone hydrolase family protein n=1 Tax=unclassified Sediminibacterium TaxID=2635961 RepID=UPI0015BB1D91|nr:MULTISPECIES: dienelactone hydrolase family protein [unclassified Sediminibacterium]MBW0161906.1 dienelactone hydrolase family protein [Sediminibacterium sp.]MBW0165859.1 dienelactone hydrolase family protein [Sediminibacterium sp.]NWK64826.1 dienelactone hydrolase family protein [Sediminibacterium sp. Gen4]
MDQQIINLYDEYTHKPLPREVFLKRLAVLAGSTAAAMTILPMLENNYAVAATVPEQDIELHTEDITYPAGDVTMKAYLAKPKKDGKYGAVIIIHENRGLNDHIRDVARRAAKAGYIAIAPDALSAAGGTPTDQDQARQLFSQIDAKQNLINFSKGFDYLKSRKDCNGFTGCVGFCWGGALVNQLAVNVPDLKAAVAFYGRQADVADVPKIKAALQLHYAGLDERINAGIPAYEEALKKNNVKYELYLYEGVNHAFHNDTSGARYNEAAAKLAWKRTLDFWAAHMK